MTSSDHTDNTLAYIKMREHVHATTGLRISIQPAREECPKRGVFSSRTAFLPKRARVNAMLFKKKGALVP